MLIDWVTCRIPLEALSEPAQAALRVLGDRIARYCPRTGEVRYETTAWDSVRSDSHQISIRAGLDFWVQGSPARILGDGDSVFSCGPSAALDLVGCVGAMVRYVSRQLGIIFPAPEFWTVSRVDVTGNLLLDNPDQVRRALRVLRDCDGGRYRVSQQAGDTVYWSHKSKLRSGKAYAKGWHLAHLMRLPDYMGRQYDLSEIEAAKRLLRLELKLGREFWARNPWVKATPDFLLNEWESYFSRMIGDAAMTNDDELQQKIISAALGLKLGKHKDGSVRFGTEGMGRAAHAFWCVVQQEGLERAKAIYSRSSFFRHLCILRAAGLGDSDLSSGKIVEFRREIFTGKVIDSWEHLMRGAA